MTSSTGKNVDREHHSGFQQDLEYLRQVPLFQGIDYECLKLMAMVSKRIELTEDDLLMIQGEDDGHGYYLISGSLNSLHRADERNYSGPNFEPGQFIGGLALLGKSIRLFTVQAAEKSTVLRLGREGFQKIMRQSPGNMAKIAANLALELADRETNLLAVVNEHELQASDQPLGISLI